jgi:hypothetical protein
MVGERVRVKADPFPHAVVDYWWDEDLLGEVLAEFPDPLDHRWKRYDSSTELKREGGEHLFGEATRSLFRSIEATGPLLAARFGLPPLTMELVGGGYHLIPPGGLLMVHTDFNRSPVTRRYRRLNLLVYLNREWKDEKHGGALELWDERGPSVRVVPEYNRTAVFQTSSRSWHGHPDPVKERFRRSVAAYFYTDEPPADFTSEHDTVWHPASLVRS